MKLHEWQLLDITRSLERMFIGVDFQEYQRLFNVWNYKIKYVRKTKPEYRIQNMLLMYIPETYVISCITYICI